MIAKRLFVPGVLLAVLALLSLNLTNSPSGAAPPAPTIDLVGTYDVAAESIESNLSGDLAKTESFTMTVTGQEGRLFWGNYEDPHGNWPMNGTMTSSQGSSTTFCIAFMPNAGGYGSIAFVAAKGLRPAEVAIEALVTSGGLEADGGRILSARMVAIRRPPSVLP